MNDVIAVDPNQRKDQIIVAPHPDDEIIGCWEILTPTTTIIYDGETPKDRREEALGLRKIYGECKQFFQMTIPQPFLKRTNTFYFPDPIHEIHPLHRRWGSIGESLARDGFNVIFYNTTMQAPYIHEVKRPLDKAKVLNEVYGQQSDLWKFDHKYFLFEGRYKWIF